MKQKKCETCMRTRKLKTFRPKATGKLDKARLDALQICINHLTWNPGWTPASKKAHKWLIERLKRMQQNIKDGLPAG